MEFVALDDNLRDEMRRLSEVNDELLGRIRSDAEIQLPSDSQLDLNVHGEIEQLREENEKLRRRARDAEQLLEQIAGSGDDWTEKQKEYETLLDEKSEVIRSLHIRLRDLQEGAVAGAGLRSAGARAADDDEVARLKEQLLEQSRQLKEDEQELMQQMRQMEMAMSRDRAELARQRSEMQRMQAELAHEIEMASRDPALREKLLSLQRRQQETVARKGTSAAVKGAGAQQSVPRPEPVEPPTATADPRKSGFLGRLFGK